MSSEDLPSADAAPDPDSGGNTGLEALACVSCRARKLKCDRIKPACTRCTKVKSECSYPESRRKPAFKRRNVKELEERLAQVEVLLKDAPSKPKAAASSSEAAPQNVTPAQGSSAPDQGSRHSSVPDVADNPYSWDYTGGVPGQGANGSPSGSGRGSGPFAYFDNLLSGASQRPPRADNAGASRNELLGLGLFEALPPTEMIEDLHRTFFMKQHPLNPIIHPGRYMQAYHSGLHLRPPMALIYAVWTMASNGHEKYSAYHDAFHRRARHYLEEDELRGEGEHFITVAHAQAWALIATDEARCMWFTRAAMSTARCIKLIHMMGLHRLDDPNAAAEMAPTIAPPRDWTELEERRRVFWGAFCVDSHASISTGWPSLIDMSEVTTHLPSSEESFNNCMEEKTCRIEEVFTGSSYSSFAGAAVICHIFNQILKHVHRSKPDDGRDDFDYGRYWNKHRELDNILSSAFMFLPERFRLPNSMRDPVAVHTNLNLHASIICLHNSAYEMTKEHDLPDHVKQTSKTRVLTAAQEIVTIVKVTSHSNAGYRSPLVALALYVASSVYTTMAQDEGMQPSHTANLEFLLVAMNAIGKEHIITRSFLTQAILDLQRAGLIGLVRIPRIDLPDTTKIVTACGNNIPLFARSKFSRSADIQPPLPGRLPLSNPATIQSMENQIRQVLHWDLEVPGRREGQDTGNANKRKRIAISPEPTSAPQDFTPSLWFQPTQAAEVISSSSDATTRGSSLSSASVEEKSPAGRPANAAQFRLPHRGGSSAGSSPSAAANSASTPTTQPSSGVSPRTAGAGQQGAISATTAAATLPGAQEMANPFATDSVDMNFFQSLNAWDGSGDPAQDPAVLFSQVTAAMQGGGFGAALDDDSWMMINDAGGGGGGGTWDTGQGGTGGVG
ncbi:hypothetical protein N8I77_007445 [Diaporthe amygdali]|uniref:Zn(2)-C6 fungal-type domain-containing protein n=1 Tax=Phomopsis amygdali TaxID=1214568 RepID=A0AAD9W1K3_PHOAM|nr:hypothetical protein N8I77_007445 [Diaporthe amygdali]